MLNTSIKLKLLNIKIILSGITMKKVENINMISCLFKTINIVDSGDVKKFKNNQGAIIEADSPANFQFSPNTNTKISIEKKYIIRNAGAAISDALMMNFFTIVFKSILLELEIF